jgi:predicted DNA-binding transcriptional regulator AlpA
MSIDVSTIKEVVVGITEQYSEIWLTEKQVSILIGLSLSTLQKNRHKRKGIKYTKIGRSVRYALSDVIEYMNSHKIEFVISN